MTVSTFDLRGEFITLDALLKATGIAPSGGAAKAMVAQGVVQVDGQVELRKTCKIRAGQVVTLAGQRIHVQAADADADADAGAVNPAASDPAAAPPARRRPAGGRAES